MKEILTLSAISPLAGQALGDNYTVVEKADAPEGILVRAFEMKDYVLPESVKIIARAGAGVNNIPLEKYASQGVVVCNTPGANSNGVKELTVLALLLCARDIIGGINWTQGLKDGETTVEQQVEKGKKAFGGTEIINKTLGLLGFGVIGRKVAEAAHSLGMKVVFVDPFYYGEVPCWAKKVDSNEEVLRVADYLSVHVPLLDSTRGFINEKAIALMKDGASIINIARGELIDDDAIIKAVSSGKIRRYVTDFPNSKLLGHKNIITIPHLGASTEESEDNCAEMAGAQIKAFIEKGDIINSVNYPSIAFEAKGKAVTVLFKAEAKEAVEKVITSKKTNKYEIKVKGSYGAAKADICACCDPVEELKAIDGVLKVYTF